MNDRKLLLLREYGHCFCAILENDRLVQLEGFGADTPDELGNIFIGRVSHIVKNINAAFVFYGTKGAEKTAYLDLSVYDQRPPEEGPLFVRRAGTSSKTGQKQVVIHQQDELVLQITKPAVKLKKATATCDFQLPGRFLVYLHGTARVLISSKIRDKQKKKELIALLTPYLSGSAGILVRTAAKTASEEELLGEAAALKTQYETMVEQSSFQTAGACLYREAPAYLRCLKKERDWENTTVFAEDAALYEEAAAYIRENLPDVQTRLHRYVNTGISLFHLYGIRNKIEKAVNRRVWLKSGGFLVIEPTEALTVIDVNTGKAIDGKKSREDTFFAINLEAAREIALQLRVRNLSGIILIDFINLKDAEKTHALIREFRQQLSLDPVKCAFEGMTRLQLAEMTRQKTGKPLHEQLTDSIRRQLLTTEGETDANYDEEK